MSIQFYDTCDDDGQSGVVEINRVYCFDFRRFTDTEWEELDKVYRVLSSFVGYDPVPRWFSAQEHAAPYLWASVEPPGLQVAGALYVADWHTWDQQFRAGVDHLPSYAFE